MHWFWNCPLGWEVFPLFASLPPARAAFWQVGGGFEQMWGMEVSSRCDCCHCPWLVENSSRATGFHSSVFCSIYILSTGGTLVNPDSPFHALSKFPTCWIYKKQNQYRNSASESLGPRAPVLYYPSVSFCHSHNIGISNVWIKWPEESVMVDFFQKFWGHVMFGEKLPL